MKYYFATTTLNVDNILSTESIAPYSIYKNRKYGYNSFYKLEQIPYSNILILFSKIPYFGTFDKEQDSHPMVLEIDIISSDVHLKKIAEQSNCTIYSTDDIIRITPYNCKLLFFNPTDLNHAKLSCSDSLTNKFGDRFCYILSKGEFDINCIQLNSLMEDICDSLDNKVLKDNRLDKVKGFIFGYYLGVSKSLSSNSAYLLKIQKRIYDIVASVKSNGGYANKVFYEEITKLDGEYRKNDPAIKQCREQWNKYLEGLGIPAKSLDILLYQYDKQGIVKNEFMKSCGLGPTVSFNQYGWSNIESYREALTKYTSTIVTADRNRCLAKFLVKPTFDLDPSYETCMLAAIDDVSCMFNRFIDFLLWHGETPTLESLRTNRHGIATETTKYAKSIWDANEWGWENSSVRTYLNDLRRNIREFSPFDLGGQDDIVIKSIAAYILKGEDYDSLIQICEDNSICDYRYVLALWGATIGYTRMPKHVLSSLFSSSGFNSTYKDIISLLYNIESQGDLPRPQTIVITQIKKSEPQSTYNDESSFKLRKWQNGIRDFLKSMKRVQKRSVLLDVLEKAFAENGDKMDYVSFFDILYTFEEWKNTKGEPNTVWKNMFEYFCPEEFKKRYGDKTNKTKSSKIKKDGLLDTLVQKGREAVQQLKMQFVDDDSIKPNSIIYDDNAYRIIEGINELGSIKSLVVRQFKWFQNEYRTGFYYRNQDKYHRNNTEVIDHFTKWCLSPKNPEALPYTTDNRDKMAILKTVLLNHYHD